MFNPHARWDRPALNTLKSEHHQPIEVVARFGQDAIKPLYFVLAHKRYEITRVNYFWQDHRGQEKLYCFNVTDGVNVFYIYLGNQSLHWRLAKIE